MGVGGAGLVYNFFDGPCPGPLPTPPGPRFRCTIQHCLPCLPRLFIAAAPVFVDMAAEPSARRRTRIKMCGLRTRDDIDAAAEAGADAIGLVLHPPSPRSVSLEEAALLAAATPPFMAVTVVVVDLDRDQLRSAVDGIHFDLLQFHADLDEEYCRSFARPYIKSVPMGGGADPLDYARRYPSARALLLDGHRPGVDGGRGQGFDWCKIPAACPLPLILAGGLDSGNVAPLVQQFRPWAVDVSSGIEAEPGVKDPRRMLDFAETVRRADHELLQ